MASTEGETRFRSVYDQHQTDVLAYFLRRLSPEDAAEATADVFLVVWRRIDQLPPVSERRPWLFGVAHNVLRNRQRMSQRLARLLARAASSPFDPPLPPETIVVRRAEEVELLAALDRLSLGDREVLRLRLWEEFGFQEVASVLGCSPHAAEQRYAKALRRLRSACRRSGHVLASGTRAIPRAQEPTP